MRIKYVKAKNFLSYRDTVEIDFTKLGNIVHIQGANGAGKCFAKHTKILMFNGTSKEVQDIVVGDIIMGNDSTPRMVLALSRGREMMYRVTPTKGESYVVNESHILTLKCADLRKNTFSNHPSKNGNVYNITVRDYLKETSHFKNVMKGYRSGVEFEKKELAINPYFLGVWLGDGTSKHPHITTADSEIASAIYHEAEQRNLSVRLVTNKRSCPTYRIHNSWKGNSLLDDLREYNLLDNKHIPLVYKTSNRTDRLQLLAGLLDTDGSLSRGGFDFINKQKTLAEDVVYLARSLGFAAYMHSCEKYSQNGSSGTYYRVFISGDCSVIPVRIKRKQAPSRTINKDVLKVGIKVEPIGEDDYYGFQIDGNQLFLLADFTVVHNSTILEMIIYGLYGKMIKKLNHKEAINNKTKKGLEVEIRWDDYRIVRRRKPDDLKFWKGDEELTLGGMPATQEEIEKVIGLTYHAFINVSLFGQHNQYAFLSCDAATKRQIIENLLALEKYNDYCQTAKDKRKALEQKIRTQVDEYEILHRNVENCNRRITQLKQQQENWAILRKKDILALQEKLVQKQQEIAATEKGQAIIRYQEAQEEIAKIRESAKTFRAGLDRKEASIADVQQTRLKWAEEGHKFKLYADTLQSEIIVLKSKIGGYEAEIKRLDNMEENAPCPVCFNNVDKSKFDNVRKHNKSLIDDCLKEIKTKTLEIEKAKIEMEKAKSGVNSVGSALDKLKDQVSQIKAKLDLLNQRQYELSTISDPSGASDYLLQEQIALVKEQINNKVAELSSSNPYESMLKEMEKELKEAQETAAAVKEEIKQDEALLPYYEFWVKGFGDQGIRKFIIDGLVPSLNARVNYWLQFLVENKIKLEFNNELEETIESNPPDGDPFVYNGLSGGEHTRIDLAISQAFAHLMMLSAGTCPSVLALDEVGQFQDREGVHCVYSMICELARDRQVLIITHDPDLQEMLQGVDVLKVERKDGASHLSIQTNNGV